MPFTLQPNALVTLEDLKAFLGITDNSQDNNLTLYINAISDTIESLTKRKLKAAVYDERYQGTDETYLVLNQYPINSVTNVEYVVEDGQFQVFDPLDYEIISEEGSLYNFRTWRKIGFSSYLSGEVDYPFRYIRVQYNAGYTNIPADLQLVVMEAIKDLTEINESGSRVLKAFSISDTKWDWNDKRTMSFFSPSQMSVISRYRKYRVGGC